MAEVVYVAGAEPPVNQGEFRVVEYLKRHLPEDYFLYPGVQVIHRDRADDIDLLVLTPQALVVVEIKDIAGSFVIDNGDCYVDGQRRAQPYITTNAKARRLKSRLQDHDPRLRPLWIAPLVILARQPAAFHVSPRSLAENVVLLEGSVEKLTDPGRLLPNAPYRELGELRELVIDQLNLTEGRTQGRRFGPYECTERVSRTPDEDVWAATHEVSRREFEIRHVGLNPLTRESRISEAHGEFKAHDALSEHPWFDGPRDLLPQDDGTAALVYAVRKGVSLEDAKDADEDLDKDSLILDLVTAVATAHQAGAVHGRLAPRWVELGPEVARIRGFTLHQIVAPTRVIETDADFLAPEVLAREPAGAPADIFGLGRLIESLEPDSKLWVGLAARLTDEDVAQRRLPADYVRRAIETAVDRGKRRSHGDKVLRDESGRIVAGSLIGSHIIGELLGEGGFSQVYLVRNELGGSPRTMKLFQGDDAERFVAHEYSILLQIRDPRVVEVIDAGRWAEGWYMVSEYLDGETLDQKIDSVNGGVDVGEATLIVHELLEALHEVHSRGITHRDVKPANVILVEDRGAVLFDFGVSATEDAHIPGLTWEYWPPDLPIHVAGPDPDLFATGVVLCELLTGAHPYPNRAPQGDEQPDLSSVRADLRPIVAKAVSPESNDRFRSAQEFSAALAPFVDQQREIVITRRDLYRRVEQLISVGNLDDAEKLCQPGWHRLLQRISRKRLTADPDGAVDFHGLQIRALGSSDGRVYRLDGTGPVDATTWTYNVTGRDGLMLDIRIAEDDEGNTQIATVDTYASAEPFSGLVDRLRHGIYEAESDCTMRIRHTDRPGEGRLSQRQATLEELSQDAGVDVRQVLIEAGAKDVGRREELGLHEPSRQKNQINVLFPVSVRNDVALRAYLLTTVIPIARDLDLLIQE